jgi:EAL domain-containing protein (putative c-di-GMP-specific phosphodiesterase class I)
VKLDISVTRDVHKDPAKQAMVAAATAFAARVGVAIVAEGIETREEAEALRILGIRYGQGYYFSKPGPLPLRVSGS